MSQFYSDPEREPLPHPLPNCEVFYAEEGKIAEGGSVAGWYYWFCFPGCVPDSEPIGPYESEREAIEAAQDRQWCETQEDGWS